MLIRIFLLWRIGLFLITYLGALTLPKIANKGIGAIAQNKEFNFWASWAQWDGGHYYDIAANWYQQNTDFAFFPLFPALIRILAKVANENYLLAGLIVSNIAFLIFLSLFYRFVKLRYSREIAFTSTMTFLFFPTTFFAVAFYSESLFLLFALTTFWFLTQKKFLVASIFAGIAGMTRFVGITLSISIAYSYFAGIKFNFKKIDYRLLHVLVALFPLVIYCIYLFANFNNPFLFLTSQSFWQRIPTDPLSTILSYLWRIITLQRMPLNDYSDLGLTLLFITILALGVKKIRSSLWIYSMLVILIPASTGTLTSMPRYLLGSLGAFVIIGIYLSEHSLLRRVFWIISLIMQAILASLFVNGFWVA